MKIKEILLIILFLTNTASAFNLSGYVNDTLGTPNQGTRIDLNGNHTFTNISGYYLFNNVSGNYTILFRQILYRNNTQIVNITSDTILNIILQERKESAIKTLSEEGGGLSMLSIITIIFVFGRKQNV